MPDMPVLSPSTQPGKKALGPGSQSPEDLHRTWMNELSGQVLVWSLPVNNCEQITSLIELQSLL